MRGIRPGWILLVGAVALVLVGIALGQVRPGPPSTATPSVMSALPTSASRATPTVRTAPTDRVLSTPAPTIDPSSVLPCDGRLVAVAAGGWSGATGSLAGGITVINLSTDTCRVAGRPFLRLLARNGERVAQSGDPEDGDPVALLPGGVASATIVWSNWCGELPPIGPLSLDVRLPGILGASQVEVLPWDNQGTSGRAPRCDVEGEPSTIGTAVELEAPEPADANETTSGVCPPEGLLAYGGAWGAAAGTSYETVVVFNISGEACDLPASPAIQLLDADGMRLATARAQAGAGTILLPSGRAAITSLGFADWCLPEPKIPFAFALRFEDALVEIVPTSALSTIGVPRCQSDPPAAGPDLFFADPFALPL